jgi:phage shock protein C
MERKRFYRINRGKKIAGVCTGLAEYFNIDPVLIRVLFVATSILWAFGILLYLILWIASPVKEET